MTAHSRAYCQTNISEADSATGTFHPPRLSQLAHGMTSAQEAAATNWRDAWKTLSGKIRPLEEFESPSIIETLRHDGAAREKVIVDAFRNGDAGNIVVIDRDALGPDGFAMLEKLNALGFPLPAGSQAAEIVRTDETATGDLKLDFKICRAQWKGRPVNLTITEFNIVCLFARRMGENLTYREIYDVVHGEGFCAGEGTKGYQTNVRSLIKRIRQKFHMTDEAFAAIENHRGFGYRWQAPERPAATGSSPVVDDIGAAQARPLILMVLLASHTAD